MTLPYACLPLSLVEIGCAGWLLRHIAYKRYPALMFYLVTEAVWHLIAALWAVEYATRIGGPFRMGMRAWVVCEVFWFACVRLSRRQRMRAIGVMLLASVFGMLATDVVVHLTAIEHFFSLRQYFHIALALAIDALVVYVWRHPVPENRDHKAYRIGMSICMSVLALSGTFVSGGFGYAIFPYELRTHTVADYATNVLLALALLWMGWRMTSNISCSRRAWEAAWAAENLSENSENIS